jgi:hypothetical protein
VITGFAPITAPSAATPATARAEVAFAAARIATAGLTALAFGPRTAVFTLETATLALIAAALETAAAMAATATTAMTVAVTLLAFATFATGLVLTTGARCLGRLAAPEQAFQPAHETTGFFCRLWLRLWPAFLIRLIRAGLELALFARLELPLVATRFALFAGIALVAWITWLVTRIAWLFARVERAWLAAIATFAVGTEGRTLVASRLRLVLGGAGTGSGRSFPTQRSAFWLLRRKDL